jgi:hypothetical protein
MRAILALLVVALFAASGCQGDSGSEGPIADGRHFGYVRSADATTDPPTIDFDVAEFLTGDAASAAAAEDGVIAEGEPVPNDYYVRNEDETAVELVVAPDVEVTHIQCPDSCTEGLPGDFDAFAASFADTGEKTLADEYRGAQSQYWVIVEGGEVAVIDEQYVP